MREVPESREHLERVLTDSLDLLRDAVPEDLSLDYVMRLFVIKRLSDAAEHGSPSRRGLALHVPDASRWKTLLGIAQGLDAALDEACRDLERANRPHLDEVLTGLSFSQIRPFSHHRERDELLQRLLRDFDDLRLHDQALPQPDLLGQACDVLIEHWALTTRAGHESYTPRSLTRLMIALLDPQPAMSLCDPVCGLGTTLTEAARHVAKAQGVPVAEADIQLAGQERSERSWSLCRMNLLLHGRPDAWIERGDTLRKPELLDDDARLARFDRVIADPPFSPRDWGAEVAERDPYGRFRFGVPSRSQGDYAFIQHILETLRLPRGRATVLVVPGVLFRGGSDAQIRRRIVEADLFEAIIGLPKDLFFGTALAPVILVLSRQKPPERQQKILFIQTPDLQEGPARRPVLPEAIIGQITSLFHEWRQQAPLSRVVSLDEVQSNGFDLHLHRYLDPSVLAPPLKQASLRAVEEEVVTMERERDEAAARMDALLRRLGILPSGEPSSG